MTTPSGSQSFELIIDLLLKGDVSVDKKLAAIDAEAKKAGKTLADFSTEQLTQLHALAKAEEERTREFVKNNQIQIRELRARAKEIRAEVALLNDSAADIDRFAKPLASLGLITVAVIFAAANKYVKDAKEANEITQAWKKSQDSLNKSGQRIGAILAKTALPLLQEAAEVTAKIAGFLERNPGAAEFALKAGLVSLAVGTIGKAVAGGIRLYADLKLDAALTIQLTAAQLQVKASENQLAAAGLQSKVGTPAATGGGGSIAGAAGSVALITAGLVASKYAVDIVNIVLERTGIAKSIAEAQAKIQETSTRPYPGIITGARPNANTSIAASTAPVFLGGTEETQAALLSAYEQYKSEDLALVNSHYAERQSITDNALAQTQAANKTLASSIASAFIEATKQITAATDSFNQVDKRAEEDLLANRLKIAADGGDEILQLEQDSQDRIKKLRETFEERSQVAARSRDALALVDARKDYNKGRADEISNTNKEIARRRADIAKRLQELDVQFAKEHDRRVEDFNARIEEIKAQEIEKTVQAAAAHAAEIDRIKKEEEEKLKVEDAAFKKERLAKYNGFIAQIDDLNKYLTGDITSREAAHVQNLADLDAFLAAERAKRQAFYAEGTTAAVPVHDFTGYTPKGIYAMAQDGQTQFTLSGSSTKTMEKIVGGQLTQQNVLGVAGGRGSIVLQYSPRFDGSYTEDIKRENRKDTMRIFNQVIAGMAT